MFRSFSPLHTEMEQRHAFSSAAPKIFKNHSNPCFVLFCFVSKKKVTGYESVGITLLVSSLTLEIGHTIASTIAMMSYQISAIRKYKHIMGYTDILMAPQGKSGTQKSWKHKLYYRNFTETSEIIMRI